MDHTFDELLGSWSAEDAGCLMEGDDVSSLLQLLGEDLGEALPLLGDAEAALAHKTALPVQKGTSPASSGTSLLLPAPVPSRLGAPASPSVHSGTTGGAASSQPILLASAVCRGPTKPKRGASAGAVLPPSDLSPDGAGARVTLPALSTKATATAGALNSMWRTVTTAQQSQAQMQKQQQQHGMDAVSCLAAQVLPLLAEHQASLSPAPPPSAPAPSKSARRSVSRAFDSEEEDDEDSEASEGSNDTDGERASPAPRSRRGPISAAASGGKAAALAAAGSKRKAPEVDWRSITDPAERRRQRRLAKNRVTAARSRERKKSQWAEMEERLAAVEADNAALRDMLDALGVENEELRQQLAAAGMALPASSGGSALGGRAQPSARGHRSDTEPAVLLTIITLLMLCALLSPSPAATPSLPAPATPPLAAGLGSAAPLLMLLAALLRKWRGSWSSSGGRAASQNSSMHDSTAAEQRARRALPPAVKGSAASAAGGDPGGRSSDGPLAALLGLVVWVARRLALLVGNNIKGLPALQLSHHRTLRHALSAGSGATRLLLA